MSAPVNAALSSLSTNLQYASCVPQPWLPPLYQQCTWSVATYQLDHPFFSPASWTHPSPVSFQSVFTEWTLGKCTSFSFTVSFLQLFLPIHKFSKIPYIVDCQYLWIFLVFKIAFVLYCLLIIPKNMGSAADFRFELLWIMVTWLIILQLCNILLLLTLSVVIGGQCVGIHSKCQN